MLQNRKHKLGIVSILMAGTLWGSMGIFVRKLAGNGLGPLEIVALRSLGALFMTGVILLIYDRKLFRIKMKDIWCFIGTGILSLTFFNYCYFQTIITTSLATAAIMLYTAPVFVVLMSFFLFKEKLTGRKCVAMLTAFLGCVLVTGVISSGGMSVSAKGMMFGLGSGIGYALYSIFSRYALEKGYSSFTISFYTFLFSTVGTFCLVNLQTMTGKLLADSLTEDMIYIFGIALIATVLPYLFYTYGLESVENGRASIIASIEPVVATLIGVILFHETLTFSGVLGIVCVLMAIVMLNRTGQ